MPQMINGREFPAAGDELVFLNENGYDSQLEEARRHFVKDQVLKVKNIDIGDWSSSIEFEEKPGQRFNSVMFEPLGADVAPEVQEPARRAYELSDQEHSMVLAALRLWIDVVNDGGEYINEMLLDIATNGEDHATNGEDHALMDDKAIDALCERINV
ncbi:MULTISPECIES: hypothetical protein [unclassified Ensifer]|uniref:hypothetical protein n=1 Tax=unclassified Ensifer TaxID=2633371 RepID=UPI001146C37D|nr:MULTISPECIES: hypothetical protein [unclassified Ensifer]